MDALGFSMDKRVIVFQGQNIISRHASLLINIDSEIAWCLIGGEVHKELIDSGRDQTISSNPAIQSIELILSFPIVLSIFSSASKF